MPLTIGARLGPYEILAPLGPGGMGEVYLAEDTTLGRGDARFGELLRRMGIPAS